ncbi:tachykinin-3 [Aythya fuligula]|uniref:Tachykinin-3 n=1 Tax=Aythya fuligula TaxID=219594 RepID=A0A6J3EBN8_AYTFU|nr:tachykinin-3 [Aythya fuligula]
MRSRAVLALLALALPLALARFAAAPPPGPALRSQNGPGPEPLLPVLPWRARGGPGAAFAALLQLLREEDAGSPALASPQKRDMHDFFVGLMGKRMAEPGRAAGEDRGAAEPQRRG